jgi:hypothetical protein
MNCSQMLPQVILPREPISRTSRTHPESAGVALKTQMDFLMTMKFVSSAIGSGTSTHATGQSRFNTVRRISCIG